MSPDKEVEKPVLSSELLRKLKTTRRDEFSEKSFDQGIIDEIKNSILHTANASNRQSYSIITLNKSKAKSLKLPGEAVFVFCVDFHKLHLCSEELSLKFDSEYLLQFVTALIDISLLAQSTIIASQSLGIDTLLTNGIYLDELDNVFDILEIPEKYVFPMLALCLGYSKSANKKQKGRINTQYIFHENTYTKPDKMQIKEIISEFDAKEKNIGLISDWDAKGYNHYMEWFFKKWCPVIGSKNTDEKFIQSLKDHKMI